jgi:uncharacterized protein YegP (UPF0339 family)
MSQEAILVIESSKMSQTECSGTLQASNDIINDSGGYSCHRISKDESNRMFWNFQASNDIMNESEGYYVMESSWSIIV